MKEWNGFKSHSEAGNEFISGMMNTALRWGKARELFAAFTKQNGFAAWHIHDGWVTYNYRSGDVLDNEIITVYWIRCHAGYSHSGVQPKVRDKIVIVRSSPKGG